MRFQLLRKLPQPNAVYDADYEQLAPPRTDREFAIFSAVVFAVVAIGTLVFAAITMRTSQDPSVADILIPLIIISGIVTVGVDVYAILNTIRYFNQQLEGGKWADLQTYEISAADFVHAKYQIACLRVRGLVVTMQVLRSASYLFLIMFALLDLILHGSVGTTDSWLFTSALALMIALPMAVLLVRYEPRWQLNTLAALGLSIAAQMRNVGFASLIGIGALVLFRLVQGGLLVLTWWGVSSVSQLEAMTAIQGVLLILLLIPIVLYGLHAVLRLSVLGAAIRTVE